MDIEINHLSKCFKEKVVLQDFNAVFLENKINCLMGSSGAGKTTLINLLMGLMEPDAGEIKGIQGKRISAVFQEDRLIEHWNAMKNVKLVCEKTITEQMITQDFLCVELENDMDKPVKSFSGGMRRRVAIVRAMLAKSDLIILDEPFKGLDELLKIKVVDYVKLRSAGKTIILVTHDKEEVRLLEANLITI